jgi:hypothetical protein
VKYVSVVKYGASMMSSKLAADLTMKSGQSTREGLRTIQIAAVAAAGSASLAIDSAPLRPQFRFPDLVVRSSKIRSVIATPKSLFALITVQR